MDERDFEAEFVAAIDNDPVVRTAIISFRNDVFESEVDALKACIACLVADKKAMLERIRKLDLIAPLLVTGADGHLWRWDCPTELLAKLSHG
jgi:hypothetical protein